MTAIRTRLASTALAVTMIVGAAAPATVLAPVAAAHSVLVSVDPQDGATLETSPGRVSLTFNEEINQNFASVAVTTGDDRTSLTVGEPTVEGETVTVAVDDDLADGAYTIGYRVTSADGHVVSGSSVFTVRSAAAGSGEATATPGATGEQSDPAENQVADETSGEASSGVDPALWVVGGLAVLLIGGAFVLLRRGN
ncbi:copper resistance protein CopC [Dietzia natronolimnaea]|uniref:copper resistance protein CopC n=2 Tax=Dietzia TaxID=37914 RepID=UPI0015FB31D6|nr:copper resistance protein CopC [Dietzia natronolimnaea]